MRRPLLTLEKRLLIYHTIIVPIMLYKCDTWAIPQTNLNQSWTNVTDVICDPFLACAGQTPSATINSTPTAIQPLFVTVLEFRWRMLGHVLRMPQDTPAQLALHFAVERLQIHKGRHNIAPLPMLMYGKSEILAPSQKCFGL